jgi:hypothetical protein
MRNSILYFSTVLCAVIIFGCKSESSETSYYDDIKVIEAYPAELAGYLPLDTIIIEHPDGIGKSFLSVINEELYLFDVLRVQVNRIKEDFTLGEAVLKRGDGPDEIQSFESFCSNGEQHLFLSGWTYYVYDDNWEIQNKGVLEFYTYKDLADMANSPRADMVSVYELKYYEQRHFLRGNELWIQIESSNPKFNFVMHPEYYEDARIAGVVDLNDGKVKRILGRKSPSYRNYSFIPHHDQHYWDFSGDGKIFISFEPDSLIYICDENLQPIFAFGAAGQQMRQDYQQINTYDDYESMWFLSRTSKGYYKHLNVFDEGKLLFRSYNQGMDAREARAYGSNPKRLQIFKDYQLVADVPVPGYFKIIGKIGDYYYADGSAENRNNEEVILYRFRLNDLLP